MLKRLETFPKMIVKHTLNVINITHEPHNSIDKMFFYIFETNNAILGLRELGFIWNYFLKWFSVFQNKKYRKYVWQRTTILYFFIIKNKK